MFSNDGGNLSGTRMQGMDLIPMTAMGAINPVHYHLNWTRSSIIITNSTSLQPTSSTKMATNPMDAMK